MDHVDRRPTIGSVDFDDWQKLRWSISIDKSPKPFVMLTVVVF